MVVLVPSNDLNPESTKYYGTDESTYRQRQKFAIPSEIVDKCPEKTYDEVNSLIDAHLPKTPEALEMLEFMQRKMKLKSVLAIETDHCVESYGCLIIS